MDPAAASEINPSQKEIFVHVDSSSIENEGNGVVASESGRNNDNMPLGDSLKHACPCILPETNTCMDPRLYEAAAKGDIDAFKDYKHLDSLVTPKKNTVLHIHITAQYGKMDYITDFVKSILAVRPTLLLQTNSKGETPMHMAARHGRLHIARDLIEQELKRGVAKARHMLRMTNKDGDTALHEAVRFNHIDVVGLILDTEDREFSYTANDARETPLYLAAERGFSQLVNIILETYESPPHRGPNGKTALHAAVIGNYEAMIRKILERMGALTKEVDQQGWTPLHYAAYLGHVSIVKLLLQHDISTAYLVERVGKRTALHIAAGRGHSDIVKEFISCCPDCCEMVDKKGWNVLHFAIESRNKFTVLVVLGYSSLGNLINEKDDDGNTPLHHLVASNSSILDLIYDPRVDKMAFNNKKLNALDVSLANNDQLSSQVKDIEIIGHLRQAGAKEGLRSLTYKDDVEKAMDEKERKEVDTIFDEALKAKDTQLIVVTLVAAVSITASITFPGGYVSDKGPDQGTPILKHYSGFHWFALCNSLAMYSSIVAVFIYLLLSFLQRRKRYFLLNFMWASFMTVIALGAMAAASFTGLFTVLEEPPRNRTFLIGYGIFFLVLCFLSFAVAFPFKEIGKAVKNHPKKSSIPEESRTA